MGEGRRRAARWGGILAQALTAWALVFVLASGSLFSGCLLFTALLVPFRSNGRDRDRAVSNFSSGLLLWGVLLTHVLESLLGRLSGSPAPVLSPQNLLLLTATVLFVFAGAFFWVEREDRTHR